MRKLNEHGLTQAQECFLQKYLETSNGYQSYIFAYPSSKNWKRNSVDVQVNKLLNNAKINQRICEHNRKIESALAESITLNKRKLIETALQMLEDTNNPAERAHAVSIIKMLFQKEGMLQPQTNITINNSNTMAVNEVSNFLDL